MALSASTNIALIYYRGYTTTSRPYFLIKNLLILCLNPFTNWFLTKNARFLSTVAREENERNYIPFNFCGIFFTVVKYLVRKGRSDTIVARHASVRMVRNVIVWMEHVHALLDGRYGAPIWSVLAF